MTATADVEGVALAPAPPLTFELPCELVASEPPEARGLPRDGVRLLVATDGPAEHVLFRDIGRFLRPGDLVVVNTAATVPAAADGWSTAGRGPVTVHFSTPAPDGGLVVELRRPGGAGPVTDAYAGEEVRLPGDATLELLRAYPASTPGVPSRLWRARLEAGGVELLAYLTRHGRPISYGYLRASWPIASYQTVFAADPGSAEMASAGRPFTTRLVTDLATAGVVIAPITLYAGVSSQEAHEPPQSEWYRVPPTTARLVGETRAAGGRVVAIGTTVTRALETVAREDGTVRPGEGWTDLVLGPDRPARVVDGLVTGWHAPEASHLLLLEAVAGREMVASAYSAALSEGYLWHEFGDSALLLPEPRVR